MATSSTRIPKPKDWQEFERQIEVLAQEWLGDPNAKGNGRQGQAQNGVDVFGKRGGVTHVGIQCKEKFEKAVTEKELRAEVKKAQNFKPSLNEFVLATTAPRDATIQRIAREISENCSFTVSVWGWEDIEQIVSEHARAQRAFDPTYSPIISEQIQTLRARSDTQNAALLERLDALLGGQSRARSEPLSDSDNSTELHGKITLILSLIDEGDLLTAVPLLDRLVRNELDNATPSEAYRLKIAQANISIKREMFEQAGSILIDAATGYPEHKSAPSNLAIGYLLVGRSNEAILAASNVLSSNRSDQKMIETLAQAKAQKGDDDPLEGIDAANLNSSIICGLRANLARVKGEDQWRQIAREGAALYPDDKFLRRFAAEAVIDTCLTEAPFFMIGEAAQSVSFEDVSEAASELVSQIDRLKEIGGGIDPVLAHNAALAARLADRSADAKRVLEAGLSANPEERALVEQNALQAVHEGDTQGAIASLTGTARSEGGDLTLAAAFIEAERFDDAHSILQAHELLPATLGHQFQFMGVWFEFFRKQDRLEDGTHFFEELARTNADQPIVPLFLAKAFRRRGDMEAHQRATGTAVRLVTPGSGFGIAYEVADEAFRAEQYENVLSLLSGRVAFDRENEPLSLCIAAAMNGDMVKAASDLLDRIPADLKNDRWYRRVRIALAQRVGDKSILPLLNSFLQLFPDDAEVRSLRVGVWQTTGEIGEIRKEFEQLDFAQLTGRPSAQMQLFRVATAYDAGAQVIPLAYRLLLENWEDMDCHLGYQGVFLSNDRIEGIALGPQTIANDCAFTVENSNGERRYRIESERPATFGDEWLPIGDDLAAQFEGKGVGETVIVNGARGDLTHEIKEIKSVYLDALHRSLHFFNERFPSSGAMFQMSIDPDAEDPFVEMKDMIRRMGERDEQIVGFYRDQPLPIVWIASLLGKDEIECAVGIPAEAGVPFRICQGSRVEREAALEVIRANNGRGVVVDTITAVLIKRLDLYDAVTKVCGPLHATSATIERLAARYFEAKGMIGRSPGSLGYRNGNYVLTESTSEQVQAACDVREDEWNWARANLEILPALPRSDLSQRSRDAVAMIGVSGVAPALAANGALLPLLADDFGSRVWAKDTLQVDGLWLQPVLMESRERGHMSYDDYAKAALAMVDAGFSYVSLDVSTLLYALRQGDYDGSKLSKPLEILCGKSADLMNNLVIASGLLNALASEPCPPLTRERVASEIARKACYPRWAEASKILAAIIALVQPGKAQMRSHLSEWLWWNSMGQKRSSS